jgi:hypothetical protein
VIDTGLLFLDSARPEAIHQHTLAVSEGRLIIGAFDFNRHLRQYGPQGFSKRCAIDIIVT